MTTADDVILETENYKVIADQIDYDYDGNPETIYFLDEKYGENGLHNLTSGKSKSEIVALAHELQACADTLAA